MVVAGFQFTESLPIVLIGCLALTPMSADAGCFNLHGETIAEIGKSSPGQQSGLQDGDSAIGYRYEFAEVLWIKLWTWGGQWCLCDSQESETISSWKAAQLLGVERSQLTKPFQYKFPPGVLVLGGLLSIAASVKLLPKRPRVKRLFQDGRYQRAIGVMQASFGARGGGDFAAAVQYLEEQGVPRDVAERNLATMVAALTLHANSTKPLTRKTES